MPIIRDSTILKETDVYSQTNNQLDSSTFSRDTAIWSVKNILVDKSRTKIFPDMNFNFALFLGKSNDIFVKWQQIEMSRFWDKLVTNGQTNERTDGQTDERTNTDELTEPIWWNR